MRVIHGSLRHSFLSPLSPPYPFLPTLTTVPLPNLTNPPPAHWGRSWDLLFIPVWHYLSTTHTHTHTHTPIQLSAHVHTHAHQGKHIHTLHTCANTATHTHFFFSPWLMQKCTLTHSNSHKYRLISTQKRHTPYDIYTWNALWIKHTHTHTHTCVFLVSLFMELIEWFWFVSVQFVKETCIYRNRPTHYKEWMSAIVKSIFTKVPIFVKIRKLGHNAGWNTLNLCIDVPCNTKCSVTLHGSNLL